MPALRVNARPSDRSGGGPATRGCSARRRVGAARPGWFTDALSGLLLLPLVFAGSGALSPATAQEPPACETGTYAPGPLSLSGMRRQYKNSDDGIWHFWNFSWKRYTCRVNGRDPHGTGEGDDIVQIQFGIEVKGANDVWKLGGDVDEEDIYLGGNRTRTVRAGETAVTTQTVRVRTYWFRQSPTNWIELAGAPTSDEFTFTTGPPSPPINLTVTKDETWRALIKLTWDVPANQATFPFDGYILERSIDEAAWEEIKTVSGNAGRKAHSRLDIPTTDGSYRYRVRTWTGNDGGDNVRVYSAWTDASAPLAAGPPGVPTGVEAVKDGRAIRVNFSDPANSATHHHDGYIWERSFGGGDWEAGGTISQRGSRSATEVPTVEGTYRYRVKTYAEDPIEPLESDWVETSFTVGAPGAPTAVAIAADGAAVRVSWSPPANAAERPVDGYLLLRSINGNDWEDGGEISGPGAQSHTEIPCGQDTRQYQVKSYADFDPPVGRLESSWVLSTPFTFNSPASPDPPTVTAMLEDDAVTLTWEPPANPGKPAIDGYLLERSIDEGDWEEVEDIGEPGAQSRTERPHMPGSYRYRVKSYCTGATERVESASSNVPPALELASVGDPDVNEDDAVNANDALILYYSYSLRGSLGNGR